MSSSVTHHYQGVLEQGLQWSGSIVNSNKGQDDWKKEVYLPASANRSSPRHCWYKSRTSWSSIPLSSYNKKLKRRQNITLILATETHRPTWYLRSSVILVCEHCKVCFIIFHFNLLGVNSTGKNLKDFARLTKWQNSIFWVTSDLKRYSL